MKMKFQTSHLWVSPTGKLTQTFSYHWEDVPDLSDEPELPQEEITWDDIPDPSETFVDVVIRLVESIKQRDQRIPVLECEKEISSSEGILVDTILHQSPEESVRLLNVVSAYAFPGILVKKDPNPRKKIQSSSFQSSMPSDDIARSLFTQAITEWIELVENNIETIIPLFDQAIPIHSAKHRLQMIRKRIEHQYITMPFHVLRNNLTETEIAETADCLYEKKKFEESVTNSEARFLFACILGKNFKSTELASASNNNKHRDRERYPFIKFLSTCRSYYEQK